jgi:hypothetical protein
MEISSERAPIKENSCFLMEVKRQRIVEVNA